ncbi:MAG TPA: hypothetical protein VG753_02085 [Candidatus Paceibacterota bacterium]|nr:hypothetical protein [Candidatus Paceibacterota bacterium]
MPHHTSIYAERQRKPAQNLAEALDRLREMVKRRAADTRYASKGTPVTRRITQRIIGERD